MNISGILVQSKPQNTLQVCDSIRKIEGCEVHFSDELGRIIVTVEGEDTGEEIERLRAIQNVTCVISADMVYAYGEDEMDKIRDILDGNDQLPEWLNDPDVKIEDIKYNGDLKGKMI